MAIIQAKSLNVSLDCASTPALQSLGHPLRRRGGGSLGHSRYTVYLIQARHPLRHEPPPELLQRAEEALFDDFLHRGDGGVAEDDVAEFVVEVQEFEEGAAAAVAGAEAAGAAGGGVELGFAVGTARAGRTAWRDGAGTCDCPQDADEPLGEDEGEGVGDQVRLDLRSRRRKMAAMVSLLWTVEKTRWPVMAACMACRAVSSSRISPSRMTSGSWRRTGGGGQVVALVLVDGDLGDAGDLVLDRVFDGDDVAGGALHVAEGVVERRGFAPSRWARRRGYMPMSCRRPA